MTLGGEDPPTPLPRKAPSGGAKEARPPSQSLGRDHVCRGQARRMGRGGETRPRDFTQGGVGAHLTGCRESRAARASAGVPSFSLKPNCILKQVYTPPRTHTPHQGQQPTTTTQQNINQTKSPSLRLSTEPHIERIYL